MNKSTIARKDGMKSILVKVDFRTNLIAKSNE